MPYHWTFFSYGAYNVAYHNQGKSLVGKVRRFEDDLTDLPKRSIRIWNQLNAQLKPKAQETQIKGQSAWMCPYVQGRQATDAEIAQALLDIYLQTGRIVLDAIAHRNFLTNSQGQVFCIDVGLALRLNHQTLKSPPNGRRPSLVSTHKWQKDKTELIQFLAKNKAKHPLSVGMIQALLFLQLEGPETFDAHMLKKYPSLVHQLTLAFRMPNPRYKAMGHIYIKKYQALERIKHTCTQTLIKLSKEIPQQASEIQGIVKDISSAGSARHVHKVMVYHRLALEKKSAVQNKPVISALTQLEKMVPQAKNTQRNRVEKRKVQTVESLDNKKLKKEEKASLPSVKTSHIIQGPF